MNPETLFILDEEEEEEMRDTFEEAERPTSVKVPSFQDTVLRDISCIQNNLHFFHKFLPIF